MADLYVARIATYQHGFKHDIEVYLSSRLQLELLLGYLAQRQVEVTGGEVVQPRICPVCNTEQEVRK